MNYEIDKDDSFRPFGLRIEFETIDEVHEFMEIINGKNKKNYIYPWGDICDEIEGEIL